MPLYPSQDAGVNELSLARFYEQERIGLTGQAVNYYVLDRSQNVDPLYDEPYAGESLSDGWSYTTYKLVAAIEFQEDSNLSPTADEQGFRREFDAVAYMSYNDWDTAVGAASPPKIGDIMFCMNKYFDIVKDGSEGNFIDTADAVGFRLELRQNDKFSPDRKGL